MFLDLIGGNIARCAREGAQSELGKAIALASEKFLFPYSDFNSIHEGRGAAVKLFDHAREFLLDDVLAEIDSYQLLINYMTSTSPQRSARFLREAEPLRRILRSNLGTLRLAIAYASEALGEEVEYECIKYHDDWAEDIIHDLQATIARLRPEV